MVRYGLYIWNPYGFPQIASCHEGILQAGRLAYCGQAAICVCRRERAALTAVCVDFIGLAIVYGMGFCRYSGIK